MQVGNYHEYVGASQHKRCYSGSWRKSEEDNHFGLEKRRNMKIIIFGSKKKRRNLEENIIQCKQDEELHKLITIDISLTRFNIGSQCDHFGSEDNHFGSEDSLKLLIQSFAYIYK